MQTIWIAIALLVASLVAACVGALRYHSISVRLAYQEGYAAGLDEALKAVRGREARE